MHALVCSSRRSESSIEPEFTTNNQNFLLLLFNNGSGTVTSAFFKFLFENAIFAGHNFFFPVCMFCWVDSFIAGCSWALDGIDAPNKAHRSNRRDVEQKNYVSAVGAHATPNSADCDERHTASRRATILRSEEATVVTTDSSYLLHRCERKRPC